MGCVLAPVSAGHINTYDLMTDHEGVQPAQVVVDGHVEGTGGKLSPLTNSAEAKGSSE